MTRLAGLIVLGLSTSTPRGSVALANERQVLATCHYDELRAHAERLFGLIDEACAQAGIGKKDIGAIACDVGPGSFTGVRVAVSAANGIALALRLPLLGLTSLEAMATAARAIHPDAPVLAALDAHKDELYLGRFDASGEELFCRSRAEATEMLRGALASGHTVVGSVVEELGLACTVRSAPTDLPDAGVIALIGASRTSFSPSLSPVYVRPPDAKPAVPPGRIA